MYMGNQRRAIVLKDSKNCMFEAAYFILKDGFENQNESEMIKEANRILKNNIIGITMKDIFIISITFT